MKTPINDGGPAFPCVTGETGYGHSVRRMVGDMVAWDNLSTGITIRDWFAGMALQGWMAQPDGEFAFLWENDKGEKRLLGYGATPAGKDIEGWRITRTPDEAMAQSMYAKADAMLAERAKQP